MAEFAFSLEAKPILGGADLSIGSNRIVERDDLALVSVATPLGGEGAITSALSVGWSLESPAPTLSTTSGQIRAIRTASDQILLVFPHSSPDANQVIQSKLNGAGYTTDQTDVWVAIEVSGPDTFAALERLCPLNIRQFPDNGAGRTMMEHMGALIVRLGLNHVLLLSASSSAQSFLHAVETSFKNIAN